ncbi:unnamed protein product [Caenorhabditis auriculariae]|uniref:Uncharacterized protein n=1 Tax=Caenorhabditis auriculariae TaxID=2777116 RepID=A0A8S1HWT5_9PELO|nr:unnamed protein product [Caenorhabditis auriculariae]
MLIFFLFILFPGAVFARLLRINEWYSFKFDSHAILDVNVFATCDKFTMIFGTEKDELTRLRFRFDDLFLKKLDVDSLDHIELPRTSKVDGGCREMRRKALRINVTANENEIEFRIADQVIKRPFELPVRKLQVAIPQNVPCCLIRGLLLTDIQGLMTPTAVSNLQRVSSKFRVTVQKSTTAKSQMILATSTPRSNSISKGTEELEVERMPSTSQTPSDDSSASSTTSSGITKSWTHTVNEEWSTTFIVCCTVITGLMSTLVLFGVFMFFYLMTKPKGGKSPYSIDT